MVRVKCREICEMWFKKERKFKKEGEIILWLAGYTFVNMVN